MRRLLPGRRRVPADLRGRLGIPAGERLLAWGSGPLPGGSTGYLAATDRALHVEATGAAYGWEEVGRAAWQEPVLDLELLTADGGAGARLRLVVEDSGDLPSAVHDRVTASVIVSERVEVAEGVKARMVARRAFDDGPVRWSVVFDAGVDASDPALQAHARTALADLRSALGI